jgi:hypothetical protein
MMKVVISVVGTLTDDLPFVGCSIRFLLPFYETCAITGAEGSAQIEYFVRESPW